MRRAERFLSMGSLRRAHQLNMTRLGEDCGRRLGLLSLTFLGACAPRVDLIDDDLGEGGAAGSVQPAGGTSGTSGTGGAASSGNDGGKGGAGGTGGTILLPDPPGAGTGGISPAGSAGVGGSSGTGVTATALNWDMDGSLATNSFGIYGGWYSFDDCADASAAGLPCTARDGGHVGPDDRAGWWIADTNAVCVRGVAPRVDTSAQDAYALQWGMGVGFTLDEDSDLELETPFDAVSRGIIGFAFDVTGSAEGGSLRFNAINPGFEGEPHHTTIQIPIQNRAVYFDEPTQGAWIANPTPFAPEAIRSVQFHVPTTETSTTAFDYCIRNFRVLRAN